MMTLLWPSNDVDKFVLLCYHDEEDDGHPLVVRDHVTFIVFVFFWDVSVEREVVRVSHPAVAVCVRFPVSTEVSGAPAVDLVA